MLLLDSENLVPWDKIMLSDVDHELILGEDLDFARSEAVQLLTSNAGSALEDHNCSENIELAHLGGDLLDRTGANLVIRGIEHKDLLVIYLDGIHRCLALIGGLGLLEEHVERLSGTIEGPFELI